MGTRDFIGAMWAAMSGACASPMIGPGDTMFTVMPAAPNSLANAFVRPQAACFLRYGDVARETSGLCCDQHRFVPGAFVWGRSVLTLRTQVRRLEVYPRRTAAA